MVSSINGSVNSGYVQATELVSSDATKVNKPNIKELLEDLVNNDPLEKSMLGKGFDILPDEAVKSIAHLRLMGSYMHNIDTMETDSVINEIMDKASIEDLKEFLSTGGTGLLTQPKATENLLKKLNLYDSNGKSFLKLVTQDCAKRLAEIVEGENSLKRLAFLTEEEKDNCNSYMSDKSSKDNIKFLQNMILKYYGC